jgi:X-Pro dipeptidyl-peptidase
MPASTAVRAWRPGRVVTGIAICSLAVAAIGASRSARPAGPVFRDGQAQVVPEFQDPALWVRQRLWVETEFDSDMDGKRDRVHVDVTRPGQTEGEGLKVPVIYESSPYFAGTSGPRQFLWDVKHEIGAEPPRRTSQPAPRFQPERTSVSASQVTQWVPRGFAVVHSEAPGTGLSQGCATVGGQPEILAPKAVIDWLNGRARGFTTPEGSEEVRATWSTGKVGMTGTSYNGTIPLAAAATGVAGLEAVIPIAPNTSYYHYYRSNGLVRHPGGWLGEDIDFLYDFVISGNPDTRERCNRMYRDSIFVAGRDRLSGDYNDFWESRDLLPLVRNIRAAVLLVHGLNDWNVVPEHSIRIYEALRAQNKPAQLYLHQGGHGGGASAELTNRWFTHYLYGIDNGVDKDPRLSVVREGGGRGAAAVRYAEYPDPASAPAVLHPAGDGNKVGTLQPARGSSGSRQRLIDDVQHSASSLAAANESQHRLLFATPVLADSLRISGSAMVTISLAASKPAANLSVYLVTLPFDSTRVGTLGVAGVVTRGWADPQNSRSLTRGGNYDSKLRGEPLTPGSLRTLTFSLQPDDQIIPPGRQLGLMIFSSDRDFTLWPAPGTELTVDIQGTTLTLPVVGGETALRRALGSGGR